jgi:hypothetical protein
MFYDYGLVDMTVGERETRVNDLERREIERKPSRPLGSLGYFRT